MDDERAALEVEVASLAHVLNGGGKEFRFSRVFLVGEGRAGKTALANALQGRHFRETESTVGVANAMLEVRSGWEVSGQR